MKRKHDGSQREAGEDCCALVNERDWVITRADEQLLTPALRSWLPRRIFDVHAHLWVTDHFSKVAGVSSAPQLLKTAPTAAATFADFTEHVSRTLHAGADTSALFFGFPHAHVDVAAANAWWVCSETIDTAQLQYAATTQR